MLKGKLHESTYIAVENLEFNTVDSSIDRLKSVFAQNETLIKLRGRLDALTKPTDESMLTYINRVMDTRDGLIDLKRREVGGDLYENEIAEMDRVAIEGSRDGLPPDFRLRMNRSHELTLQQVINDTVNVDKHVERDLRKLPKGSDKGLARNDLRNVTSTMTQPSNAPQGSDKNTNSQSNAQVNVILSNIQCNYCKSFEHYKSDCKKLAWTNTQRQAPRNVSIVPNQGASETKQGARSVQTVE